MNRNLIIAFSISLLSVGYLSLPTLPIEKWENVKDENAIIGSYQQSTGGDFVVYGTHLDQGKPISETPKFETNITGNIPSNDFEYSSHYDVMLAKFILRGELIGTVTIESYGEVGLFEVESYSIAEYVPNLYSFSGLNISVMLIAAVSLFLTLTQLTLKLIRMYRA